MLALAACATFYLHHAQQRVAGQDLTARLERLIAKYPAFADVVMLKVEGKPISIAEALGLLRLGLHADEISAQLSRLAAGGVEEPWDLAEEYFRRLAVGRPDEAIGTFKYGILTHREIYEHVRKRDEIGREFVRVYAGLLRHVMERLAQV
jgi:hypothetical protein